MLTDSTANGNNGTLGTGALAPVWTATGLQFSGQQNVSLPAALNTMKSFVAAVYINPLTSGPQPANTYPVMVSSSMVGSGFNYMYIAGAGATVGLMQINGINTFGPSVFGGGQTTTTAPYLFSGFHVLGFVCGANGASVDHFYVDGVGGSVLWLCKEHRAAISRVAICFSDRVVSVRGRRVDSLERFTGSLHTRHS